MIYHVWEGYLRKIPLNFPRHSFGQKIGTPNNLKVSVNYELQFKVRVNKNKEIKLSSLNYILTVSSNEEEN